MYSKAKTKELKVTLEKQISKGIGQKSSLKNQNVNFDGKWENKLGSEMEISTDSSGNIIGKYSTNVGKPDPTEIFDLTGYTSGDLIVFCVNFGKYGSLTSWAGQHTIDQQNNDKEVIYTLWHLARNIKDEDEEDQLWAGILAGANEYYRVNI